ncbi:MAG: hypothetical protein R2826_03355 [Thermoleophilia bacterium]
MIAPATTARAPSRPGLAEILIALACFAVLCGAALSRPVTLLEPDDYAYRASIVALSEGHIILTNAQYEDLASSLQQSSSDGGPVGGQSISQWTQLDDGRWVSEKNPGYPFLAVPFELLGSVRMAALFYGGLGCLALFVGARRWLGAWGGTWAVGLFCSSGAAMVFAWRAWMPTFTGVALLAAGAGALLWALLAVDAGERRRSVIGLLGFLALEAAMLIRYTDVISLAVACAAVLALWRLRPSTLPRLAPAIWLGSAVIAGAATLVWNALVYGSPFATGYAAGVIVFGLGAIAGDLAVGAALAAAWWGVWALYFTYYWTAQMHGGADGAVHVVRFFVPALAPIALLGAWALVRLPSWLSLAAVTGFFGLGLWSFADMAAATAHGGAAGGRPGGGSPGGSRQTPGGTPPTDAPVPQEGAPAAPGTGQQ